MLKIKSIEPTPSPNTMKINLDEELTMGASHNYKRENTEGAPRVIQEILKIDGIKGVYHVADFLAVERNAKFPWQDLLSKVRQAFGEEVADDLQEEAVVPDEHFGEINVQIQLFKGIPLQVKLTDGVSERRFGMPEVFLKMREKAQLPEDNYILLRKWQDQGVRYGEFDVVGQEVIDELIAAYPLERLDYLVNKAVQKTVEVAQKPLRQRKKLQLEDFNHPDWQIRFQLLEQMEDPVLEDLPLLEKALTDEKVSIRRLATAYLGMIKDPAVLPLLYIALKDKTVTVRRTAGDCLSDLGFKVASEKMAEALKDESKLVRWRAAMFLFEEGGTETLPSLKAAVNDPEFEVSMQVQMAIERIEGGQAAKGSVWKQMTEARNSAD